MSLDTLGPSLTQPPQFSPHPYCGSQTPTWVWDMRLRLWAGGGVRGGEGLRDLERCSQVGPEGSAAALRVDPLAAFAQDYVDLDVDEQGDDEGHVEGDDGGVDHEGGVGDDALILVCGKESPAEQSGRQWEEPHTVPAQRQET